MVKTVQIAATAAAAATGPVDERKKIGYHAETFIRMIEMDKNLTHLDYTALLIQIPGQVSDHFLQYTLDCI